jgi:hypothetical protein
MLSLRRPTVAKVGAFSAMWISPFLTAQMLGGYEMNFP